MDDGEDGHPDGESDPEHTPDPDPPVSYKRNRSIATTNDRSNRMVEVHRDIREVRHEMKRLKLLQKRLTALSVYENMLQMIRYLLGDTHELYRVTKGFMIEGLLLARCKQETKQLQTLGIRLVDRELSFSWEMERLSGTSGWEEPLDKQMFAPQCGTRFRNVDIEVNGDLSVRHLQLRIPSGQDDDFLESREVEGGRRIAALFRKQCLGLLILESDWQLKLQQVKAVKEAAKQKNPPPRMKIHE